MGKKSTVTEVPYDKQGNLMHFAGPGYMSTPHEWRANDPFSATLQIDGMRSGRSAKYVIWRSPNNPGDPRLFPMFVSDLIELMQRARIDAGIVSGRWIVRKRGQNYGLALAPEDTGRP